MKKIKYLIVMLFLVLFITPVSALDTSKDINDFYIKAEDNSTLDKNVSGSTLVAGNNVETKSIVDGIGFLFGNNIKVKNQIEYLITAGNNIDIKGEIVKDAIIAGNIVNISEDAIIGRDLIIAANEVTIYGTIQRNIKIYASKINFKSAIIKGNVEINASNINIDSDTSIAGKLNYNDDAKTEIKSDKIGSNSTYVNDKYQETFKDTLFNRAVSYASMLLIFLVIALAFPKILEKLNKKMDKVDYAAPFKWFVTGFFSLILIPFLIILLFTSTIGIPLAFLLLAFYIISICLVNVFISYVIGRLILTKIFKKEDNFLLNGFVGMVILFILSLIPYINPIVSFISLFVGLGLIILLMSPKKEK